MPLETTTQNDATEMPDSYLEARLLAESGNYEKALVLLNSHLEDKPDDAEAINDIGAILFAQGQTDQAIKHFENANQLCVNRAEILWNLCEAYLSCGHMAKAVELFSQMEKIGILNPDLLNRTANEFLQHDQLSEAADMLEWSLRMAPDQQEILEPMVTIIQSKMTSEG